MKDILAQIIFNIEKKNISVKTHIFSQTDNTSRFILNGRTYRKNIRFLNEHSNIHLFNP